MAKDRPFFVLGSSMKEYEAQDRLKIAHRVSGPKRKCQKWRFKHNGQTYISWIEYLAALKKAEAAKEIFHQFRSELRDQQLDIAKQIAIAVDQIKEIKAKRKVDQKQFKVRHIPDFYFNDSVRIRH